MSAIHQPQPRAKSPQESNRLLASHHSIYEALQNTSMPETPDTLAPTAGNTPSLLNIEFSTSSWQTIGDSQLAPRPTSSVLSSSDTEEDDVKPASVSTNHTSCALRPSSLSTTTAMRDTRDEEEKTIEIDLNAGIKTHSSFGTGLHESSFVMPELDSSEFGDIADSKILIIGHKKQVFFKEYIDSNLRHKFTLDLNAPHKIVVVIFDGLLKIGNILNFIKHHVNHLRDKLFIPVFRNLNAKVVDKILKVHGVELLCPPVSLDNEVQVQNLLDFLREDLLLRSSSLIEGPPAAYEPLALPAADITPENFQLIRVENNEEKDSNHELLLDYPNTLERNYSAKSILISHQMEGLHNSKKMKSRKKSSYQKWSILGISLTIGIGIGVTMALSITYFRPIKKVELPKPTPLKQAYQAFTTLMKQSVSSGAEAIKSTTVSAAKHIGSISRLVYQDTRAVAQGMKQFCNELFSGTSTTAVSKGYNHPLFWYL